MPPSNASPDSALARYPRQHRRRWWDDSTERKDKTLKPLRRLIPFVLRYPWRLLLMFFFWEIVGVCSYSLIGFETGSAVAGKSGMKAFITTKIGDIGLVHAGSDARFALLGGRFVGAGALLRFYVLHCVAIPVVASILMAVHFWRVRKDGGISGPM